MLAPHAPVSYAYEIYQFSSLYKITSIDYTNLNDLTSEWLNPYILGNETRLIDIFGLVPKL